MNEPLGPEVHHEVPEGVITPREQVVEIGDELRRKAEDLSHMAQERVKELGGAAGERTREAVDQIRYFSDEARAEAAMRLELAGHYLERQMGGIGEDSRELVRRHPGFALCSALAAGFLLGLVSRRLFASIGRRW